MIKIIHQSFQNIAQPLVTIINTSLSAGVFPGSLKIAKVIPVVKADDPTIFLATAGQYKFFQPLVWIKSCLEDQTQFVQFGSHRSYRFYVASRRAQFLDLFCLLFTLMIFLMSLVSLNLYCLLWKIL